MATDPLQAIRDIALTLPEATERETWGKHTFRVLDRIFVSFGPDEAGSLQLTMQTAPGEQERLLRAGHPYFKPPFVADQGWIGITVTAETDWREIAELVSASYREIAPDSLSATVGLVPAGRTPLAKAVVGVGNVIGELVEGKPVKDPSQIEAEADDDLDDGIKLRFDPDDPSATSIEI